MNGIWFVLMSYFALYGALSLVGRAAKAFKAKKNDEIYVFFAKEKALSGKWDVLVSSDDADGILEALSERYGRIYILRGADRWTEKKEK